MKTVDLLILIFVLRTLVVGLWEITTKKTITVKESRMEPDFTVIQVWLTEDYREGLIDIGWQTKSAGFGHLSFDNKDGKIHCSSETMGRNFVKGVLNKLVDDSIFEKDMREEEDECK